MFYHFLRSLAIFIFVLPAKAFCTILPVNQGTINYTTVYFEEELREGASAYELVCYDSLSLKPGKDKKVLKAKLPAFWVSDLTWGSTYCWKINCYDKEGKLLSGGSLHCFSIIKLFSNNVEETRLQIKVNKKTKHAQGLILLDYAKTAFDRSGKAVWTIPDIDPAWNEKAQVRDLKITSDNTFSFLAANIPVEMDYNGTILWKAPQPFIYNGDTIIYHHEFQKTKRGTYLVLGIRTVYRKIMGAFTAEHLVKENVVLKKVGNYVYKKALMSIIFEFDRAGNVIWAWDSNDYLSDADMNFKKGPGGMPIFGTHANAFSENEEGTKIYVGFRDISRIVKVDKMTKLAELSYGERFPSGEARFACNGFRQQHDARVTNHKSILVFNNDEKQAARSSVIELKDNATPKDSAVLWKFDLNFDSSTNSKSLSGGNVLELPNSNLMVCAGVLNRLFEVSRSKEVVWDAVVLSKAKKDSLWRTSAQYRCNWTPEIKRYHFIPQLTGGFNDAGNEVTLEVVINNTGNADDSYTIEVFSENQTLVTQVKTSLVKKNTFLKQRINAIPGNSAAKNQTLVIQSNNSALKKTLVLK